MNFTSSHILSLNSIVVKGTIHNSYLLLFVGNLLVGGWGKTRVPAFENSSLRSQKSRHLTKQSLHQWHCSTTLSTPCRYIMLSVCYQSRNCYLLPHEITPFPNRNRNQNSALSWRMTPHMQNALQSDYRIRLAQSSTLRSLERASIITTSKAFLQDSSGQNTSTDQRMLLM